MFVKLMVLLEMYKNGLNSCLKRSLKLVYQSRIKDFMNGPPPPRKRAAGLYLSTENENKGRIMRYMNGPPPLEAAGLYKKTQDLKFNPDLDSKEKQVFAKDYVLKSGNAPTPGGGGLKTENSGTQNEGQE